MEINLNIISNYIIYFMLYSIAGWICEVIFCSILAKKLINRGFFKGPYCPIYGCGAMIILFMTSPFPTNPLLVFIFSFIGAAILEYFTSWLLEKLYKIELWNYSDHKFNINGRICLENLFLFGIMGLLMRFFLHSEISSFIESVPLLPKTLVSLTALVVFALDGFTSSNRLVKFRKEIELLHLELKELERYHTKYHWFNIRDIEGSIETLKKIYDNDPSPVIEKLLLKFAHLEDKWKKRYGLLKSYDRFSIKKLKSIIDNRQKRKIVLGFLKKDK